MRRLYLGVVAGALFAAHCDDSVLPSPAAPAPDARPPGVPCAIPVSADPRVRAAMPRDGLACRRYAATLGAPRDVVEARDGTIFVSEMSTGRVSRLDGDIFAPIATGLVGPIGLREAADGALVVAEEHAHRVSRLDRATGARTTIDEGLGNVTYLAVGPDGAVYVSSFSDLATPTGMIHRVELGGAARRSAYATELVVPEGLAFDEGGRLVVAEWGRKPSTVSKLLAGGGSASKAERIATGFANLYGVVRAPRRDGWIVADLTGDRISQVHENGDIELLVRDVAAPAGLFVAANGDLLVAEHVGLGHDARGYLLRISGL